MPMEINENEVKERLWDFLGWGDKSFHLYGVKTISCP